MALVIRDRSFVDSRTLKIEADGLRYVQALVWTRRKRFSFSEINCILLSNTNLLSFQVGNEVFSIQTKPHKPRHQEAIEALVQGVRRSVGPKR